MSEAVDRRNDFLEDLMVRRSNSSIGHLPIWFLELYGAHIIEPTAFEPDASTYRGEYYYNAITNELYRKIITRNEPGIITAVWKRTST